MYIISIYIPYEGMHECFQGDLYQCKEWLIKERPKYGYLLDDLTIYEEGPDVLDVLNGKVTD